MWLLILNNAHYAPRGASMTVMTIVDFWLKVIIKIASLGKKFVGKISNILDPLNVVKW